MLLDADLAGVCATDIDALAAPVLAGRAQASISLRSNSLAIYRALGLDFVSGERVIPRDLLAEAVGDMQRLPRWGGEAFMNERIIRRRLALAVVDWPNVINVRKYAKFGAVRGVLSELAMMRDALQVLSPIGVVRQNLALLRLRRIASAKRPTSFPRRPLRLRLAAAHTRRTLEISFRRYFLTR